MYPAVLVQKDLGTFYLALSQRLVGWVRVGAAAAVEPTAGSPWLRLVVYVVI